MTRRFKPGDVVIAKGCGPGTGAVAILKVGKRLSVAKTNVLLFEAMKITVSGAWVGSGGVGLGWNRRSCTHHPDPDAIWAEYCAYQLTNNN